MVAVYKRAVQSGEGNFLTFRYQSGRQVWDECLLDGCYIRRYINCNGQILPEKHFPEEQMKLILDNELVTEAFRLGVNGETLSGGWEYVSFTETDDQSNLFNEAKVFALTLDHKEAGIRATLYTRLDGSDYIVRWLKVENTSDATLALTEVSPLSGMVFNHLYHGGPMNCEYDKKEAIISGSLYSAAYNHLNRQLHEGDFYFDEITPGDNEFHKRNNPSFVKEASLGKSGFARPAFWLRDNATGQTVVCEFAWSGNWQMKLWNVEHGNNWLSMAFGMLQPGNEALRVLKSGEECLTPQMHFGLFQDADDTIVQITHQHVRDCVLPPLPEGIRLSEIEANHRGYLCDRENEKDIKLDIEAAKSVGVEMYVIDAGWYGVDYPNEWWDIVGDWQPGPWMEHGLRPIADFAHQLGMRFGLWIEIEAFGPKCAARKKHPEYIMTRNGVPCAGGRALNLADPEVEAFCLNTIDNAISDYALDMYRIDHNHDIGLGGTRIVDGYVENTLWRYYEAFQRIFRTLRRRHPNIILQDCASGGGRLDWGTMNLFHCAELSDWMRMPRGMRIFSGVIMSLPPEILLRCFGTETGEMQMDGDLDSQLRLCNICRPILRGIAPSVEDISPYLNEKLQHFAALYRDFTRPLMKDCKVYHHTPFQPILKADRHTILEYAAPDASRALIAAFDMAAPDAARTKIWPRGLSRMKTYRVTFENSGETVVRSGDDLRENGITVDCTHSMGSELILFEAE